MSLTQIQQKSENYNYLFSKNLLFLSSFVTRMNFQKRNYEEDCDRLRQFLESHYTHDPETGKKVFKYSDMVRDVANREAVTVEIDLDEVAEFDEDLASAIRANTIRYQRLLSSTLDELIPKYRSVANPPVKDILGINPQKIPFSIIFYRYLH